jgi:UDP-glucose 4-epimerase
LYGFKTYILRYFNVFGPRQNPASHYAAVIPLFINAFQNKRQPTIYGDGEQTRDFTFVKNVVDANLACCSAPERSAGQVMNIACGDRISVNQLAAKIAEICGVECDPVYEPSRPGDVRDSQAANQRAKDLIGWSPAVRFEEGLKQTIDWYTRHQ